jgi:hypothetical protein
VRAACPPNQPALRTSPSEQDRRRLWTAVSHHSSRSARSARSLPSEPARPPNKPLRTSQPQALDCCEPSQLSGRTKCARPALRTSPSEQDRRRLWTAVSHHSSRSARSARGLPSEPARAREAPYSRLSKLAATLPSEKSPPPPAGTFTPNPPSPHLSPSDWMPCAATEASHRLQVRLPCPAPESWSQ